ncbi:MAG: hypothetical protein GF330_03055 [Candidatus Eisenbacteria bacterium]|nr:hypothetical protein [Candidatus Eisenbacteria bacterium]
MADPTAPADPTDSPSTPVPRIRLSRILMLVLVLLLGAALAAAQELPAPRGLSARDNPNDAGHGILLEWKAAPETDGVVAYEIYRLPWRPAEEGAPWTPAQAPDSAWILTGTVPIPATSYVDMDDEVRLGANYNPGYIPRGGVVHYRIRAMGPGDALSAFTPPVTATAHGDWWHTQRWNVLVIALLLGVLMVYFIRRSKEGAELYIRPIPGLQRIDEAIGRATEMGRPILFVLGTGTAGDVATLAAYTILARVAERTAEYQTKLLVPVNEPVMMVMAQATVKEAYLKAGRPEVYNPDNIFYISAMQFPYVAAVNALMLREKTATNFYMGVFHAESLLLAEAGSVTGSIQISGTDRVPQIPFFVAATDYTLIGEELYAASAYLAQDPKLVGPLKAQDLVKAGILIVAILGVLEATILGSGFISNLIEPH